MPNDENKDRTAPTFRNAVQWRAFDRTIAKASSKFIDLPPKAIESLIGKAVSAARRTACTKSK